MKKTRSLLLASYLSASCSSTQNIALTGLGNEHFRYILDFDSRVSQQKMIVLKNNYKAAFFGIALLDGFSNSLNHPNQQDSYTNMALLLKKVTLVNASENMIYSDVITNQSLDYTYSCSVYNRQLPAHKSLKILVVLGSAYLLTYG